MKKTNWLILIIISLIMGLALASCQQSVEPGKNGFPTKKEIKEVVWKKKYTWPVKRFMFKIIDQKPEWIATINKIYLEHPNLNTDNPQDYQRFIQLLKENFSIRRVKEEAKKLDENIDSGFTFSLFLLYYDYLYKAKPIKNGLK